MSDALPEDTWVNAFLSASPRPLQAALQKRLQASQTHVTALQELFKQRAALETQYADGLAKLAKNAEQGLLNGKGGVEWEKSGAETKIWNSVVSELSETSSAHSTLAALIRTDFEQPIRDIPSKSVAWRRIGEQDSSLEKTLKDYEKTAGKLDKAQSKSKGGKADSLQSELNQLTSNLSSLSPMVYTTYQRLDEDRLRALKEIIVRWGTVRADVAQRDAERAERAVAVMVSWETPDEVLRVGRQIAQKAGGSPGAIANTGSDRGADSVTSTPRTNRRLSTATAQTNDFSPRPQPRQNGSSSNLPNSGSSFAGGLKSMLSRRTTLAPNNRGRSDSASTTGRGPAGREAGTFATIGESGASDQASQQSAPPVDEEGFSVAPADRHRGPWEEPEDLLTDDPIAPTSSVPQTRDLLSDDDGPSTAGFQNTFTSSPAASNEDLGRSNTSSSQAQSKLNLALSSAPIQEDEADRQAAMEKMQQTLQMSPPLQATRRQNTARGRRDVRNTMFAAPGEDGSLGYGALALGGPSRETSSSPANANGLTHGSSKPVQSLNRQASQSSVASNNPFDSPGLLGPASTILPGTTAKSGLTGSVNETLNVVLREGTVRRLQINGEIHLSLRPGESTHPAHGPIHVRIGKFEALEKIAPNPTFVAQVPDKPGEYILNSEALASISASGPAKGPLAFKYQVFVAPGQESAYLPITLTPAFLCKSGETRMILHYKRNAETLYPSSELSKASIVAIFGEGPSVSNVQAKPAGGQWSAASRQMTWDLDSIASEGKIIAKFVTGPGETLTPLGVQATWTLKGAVSSDLGLEVVPGDLESDWTFSNVQRQMSSGKYLAEPIVNQ
ncbi:Muniscin C-terminal mu homology domain-domain-containing protein [Kockovaella imperatae]|uniref:Muniscin C-terminal mu homology domain-domain-containing protein n=1 Tax=Kockovaella imperatae TaxID=4999 RepID=A0A1Y1UB72_9TREE|nr:Muniscin C-terminal mu homology domain-domain-containing protein [Kockovaella imperatae]ORX34767.1 Muniscin C-terminal mu homology domain-domain-containing protein [Kockovaella imperatae]